MNPSKKSFFERLTVTVKLEDDEIAPSRRSESISEMAEDETSDGELTVDVYQTSSEIVIEAMIAGVKPEDLDINITRDMVTIHGTREESKTIDEENYFHKELYWGSFSRTIALPEEIEVEEAEAVEKHGLLTIKLPKIDKARNNKLKVKSM